MTTKQGCSIKNKAIKKQIFGYYLHDLINVFITLKVFGQRSYIISIFLQQPNISRGNSTHLCLGDWCVMQVGVTKNENDIYYFKGESTWS